MYLDSLGLNTFIIYSLTRENVEISSSRPVPVKIEKITKKRFYLIFEGNFKK